MTNFKKAGFKKRGGAFGGRPKFGDGKKFGKFGGKFGGEKDKGDTFGKRIELFDAVCSKCKKNCKVPFRPSGDKPVYCRDCFSGQGQIPGRNSNGKDRVVVSKRDFYKDARPRRDNGNERQYQPAHGSAQGEDGIYALKRQLTALESKVNRILEIVSKKEEE